VGRRAAAVFLAVAPLGLAPGARADEGRKVTGKELMRMGFFQDFEEISLEDLLEPQLTQVETGSARPTTPEDAPGAVSLWKREEIVALGARTLMDLVPHVPGFDLTVDNLGRTRITVRGIGSAESRGGSENVLVVVDGLPLNDTLLGGATFVNLDLSLDHARQVEFLRGPAAALYGDGALAGVIRVVSEDTTDFMGTEVAAGVGSFDSQHLVLRSGGLLGSVKISGYLRLDRTDGPRRDVPADAQTLADADRAAEGLPPISLAPGRATDGGRTFEAAYAFALREWTFSFRSRTEKSDGFIGAADALGRQTELNHSQLALAVGYARAFSPARRLESHFTFLRTSLSDLLEIYPSGYRVTGDFGSITFGEPGASGGVFEQLSLNERRFELGGSYEADLSGGHKLTAGASLRHQDTFDLEANANLDLRTFEPIIPTTPGESLAPLPGAVPEAERTTASLFAEDAWTIDERWSVTGGLRFDHLSDHGARLSPRLALVGRLPGAAGADGLGMKLLYGRAFRAPTFREQVFDLPGGRGNPALEPVVADELELALSYSKGRLRLEAHPFLSFVKGPITAGPGTLAAVRAAATPQFENGPDTKVAGLELVARGGFGVDGSYFGSYTLQSAKVKDTDQRLAGVPRHLLSLGVTFGIRGKATVTPSLLVRSDRPRAAGSSRTEVPGWAVASLAVRVPRVFRTVDVEAVLQNMFDEDYHDPSLDVPESVPGDYPRPGRRLLVRASLRF
jgi:iron complex outermembrane receptor protein